MAIMDTFTLYSHHLLQPELYVFLMQQSNIWQYILFTLFLFYSVPQYLESFVRKGPSGYGEYCTERLRRIVLNRERKELPCWIELQVETLNHIFLL